jgi:TonB C terminal
MDVVDWQDSPSPVTAKNRAPRRFFSPTLTGILGTLLLHALIIQSVSFGSRGPKAKPPETQESADALARSKADAIESLLLITLPTTANSSQAATQNLVSSLPDLSKMKIKSPVNANPPALLNLESLALSEDQGLKSAANDSDRADQARLLGIYTGQIRARIDRVWRRPRTPVNEDNPPAATADAGDSFQCQAQIVQDGGGNVQEILLPRCNGTAAWQRSLVQAIQQASPLPAPPSVKAFNHSISLEFIGLPYAAGSPVDEYELDTSKLAKTN